MIAVATPVLGDELVMTNSHWSFSQRQVAQSVGLADINFVNDFTALAYALPWLEPSALATIGNCNAAPVGAMGVLGPGTGFGVSGVMPAAESWVAIQGEGGHTTLFPRDEREASVFLNMSQICQDESSDSPLSAEHLLSGSGMELAYKGILLADGLGHVPKEAPAIMQDGLANSDPAAREVLEIFCGQLGQRASDLALTIGATGGVFIGGGIVPRMLEFFRQSEFRAIFDDKGRLAGYVEAIPTRVIIEPFATLTGAAYLLGNQVSAS